MKRGAKSWFPVAYVAAIAVYPVVNAKLRGPRTRQRYLTPVMDIAEPVANALYDSFGLAPPDLAKAKITAGGRRRVSARARKPDPKGNQGF